MKLFLYVFVIGILLFYSNGVNSKRWMALGGVYYDNIKNLNANVGAAYLLNTVKIKKEIEGEIYTQTSHTNFLYADVSKSKNSDSFGLGWGRQMYASNYRIGVNYIETSSGSLIGVEGTASILFYSAKVGVYNSKNDKNKFMLGLGFGW